MLRPSYITFCGHREIVNEKYVYQQLLDILEKFHTPDSTDIIYPSEIKIVYYCGGYGRFDGMASQAIDEMRKKYPQKIVKKIFVTPYMSESAQEKMKYIKDYYDEIIYPPLENVPQKFAIFHRNKWMIDKSDILISYVTHDWGGATQTLKYAKKKQLTIIPIK